MKKTLITLAALAMASVASAADTWTELDTDVAATWKESWTDDETGDSYYYYALTFAFDFAFSEDSLANGTSALVAYVVDGRTPGAVQHSYVLSRDSEGVYTMMMGRSNYTNDLASLVYDGVDERPTQALTAGTVYTLSADDTYSGSKISWTDANGNVQVNTRNFTDTVAVYQNLVDSQEAAGAAHHVYLNSAFIPNTSAVPEPATATLSLLALAGLAARRRRK